MDTDFQKILEAYDINWSEKLKSMCNELDYEELSFGEMSNYAELVLKIGGMDLVFKIYDLLDDYDSKKSFVSCFQHSDDKEYFQSIIDTYNEEFAQYMVEQGHDSDYCFEIAFGLCY